MPKIKQTLLFAGAVAITPLTTVAGIVVGSVVGGVSGAATALRDIAQYEDNKGEYQWRSVPGMVAQTVIAPITVPVKTVVGAAGGALVGGMLGFYSPVGIVVTKELFKEGGKGSELWDKFLGKRASNPQKTSPETEQSRPQDTTSKNNKGREQTKKISSSYGNPVGKSPDEGNQNPLIKVAEADRSQGKQPVTQEAVLLVMSKNKENASSTGQASVLSDNAQNVIGANKQSVLSSNAQKESTNTQNNDDQEKQQKNGKKIAGKQITYNWMNTK